jgi:hypothetical protein
MISTFVIALFIGVGPVLEPEKGAKVTSDDVVYLPSSEHLGSIVDHWLTEVTNMAPTSHELSAFDDLHLSSHGRSWTSMRYFLGPWEVSDPARPGQALWLLPVRFWHAMHYKSLWTSKAGMYWSQPKLESSSFKIGVSGAKSIGGWALAPPLFMDREPPYLYGAEAQRRRLQGGGHLFTEATWKRPNGAIRMGFEHRQQGHFFPTLMDELGKPVLDWGARTTAMIRGEHTQGDTLYSSWLGWQRTTRSHEGGQYRHPLAYTLDGGRNAWMGALHIDHVWAPGVNVDGSVSVGIGFDEWKARSEKIRVFDLERQWNWLRRLKGETELSRVVVQGHLGAHFDGPFPLRLTSRAKKAWITSYESFPGDIVGVSYQRGLTAAERSVQLWDFQPAQEAVQDLSDVDLDFEGSIRTWGFNWRLSGGLTWTRLSSAHGSTLALWAPSIGLLGRRPLAGGEFTLLIRRQPEPLTFQVGSFINPDRPSASIYQWNDDGDGVPESKEKGVLIRRFGGDSHKASLDLVQPSGHQVLVGWDTPLVGPFRLRWVAVARFVLNPWEVHFDDKTKASYTPVTGQRPENIEVYARDLGQAGQEITYLGNSDSVNFYAGTQLQFYTEGVRRWFVKVGLKGYWNYGSSPFGVFADRNDPGIIDPLNADPNNQVNAWGRFDHGRAYGINIIAGLRGLQGWWQGLSGAWLLRYRDGEPMTRILVVEDLPQGPTAIMAVARGDPIPRFTFHMTLDFRLRYAWTFPSWAYSVHMDILNIFNSSTEIGEQLASGRHFRRSLEGVAPRSVRLTAAFEF